MIPVRIAVGRVVLTVGALFCTCFSTWAQSGRGNVSGTVRDSSGASVPRAKVTVTNTATGEVADLSSNDSGDYIAADVPVGTYQVRVVKEGFNQADIRGVVVNAAETARVDVTLQLGQSRQVVEVQANALQVNSEDAQSAVTVNQTLVNELPLVVAGTIRSPFDLAALTPEAKNTGSSEGFALGGGEADSYQATLDGVSIDTSRALQKNWVTSNAPSVEAITQFTVDTNGFKAEFGHAGGGVMMFVAKSGTNDLHGSAYEFIRNTDFDANDWFSNRAAKARQVYKQNDFGFTAGGPVYIPKLYHGRNKTFWFFSYEGFRNRNGATNSTATVPTPEMYNGDFRNWVNAAGQMIPIYDPTTQVTNGNGTVTRAPYPNNIIPASEFNATSIQALKVFQSSGTLKPNNGAQPGTLAYVNNNYIISNGTNVQPVNKWSIKGDHLFNDKHRISGYYGYDRESTTAGPDGPPTLPGLYTNYNDLLQASDVVRFSWDWTMTPTKFNHFYAGGNNWRQDHKPPQEYTGDWQSKFCLGNVPNCNQNLVNLFSGGNGNTYSTWGGQADNGSENTVYSYNDDFTWIKGEHTFKFGGAWQITHYNGFGRQCEAGCVGFSYTETGVPGVTNPLEGGNAFASFLLGYADSGQIDTPRFIGQQFNYFSGFAQDDWHVNRKLVLNLGLRWETTLPPTGLDDRYSDFSPNTPNPNAGGILGAVIFAGSGTGRQGTRSLADSYFRAFGPHAGFAYSYDQKTVLRGSYARSYAPIQAVSGSTHNMGFTLTDSISNPNNGINPLFILSNGFPAYTVPPFINPSVSNGTTVSWWQGAEATHPPTTDNFNFSIQRQLKSTMLVETAFNGVIGSHLQAQLDDYNQDNPSVLTQFGSIEQSTKVLNSKIGSALADQYGIFAPFPNFSKELGSNATVKQALRPYPQYTYIDTFGGEGDHSGHSSYYSGMIRFEKRAGNGLTIQTSYVFSKLITDADSYWGNNLGGNVNAAGGGGGCCVAANQYDRSLEKSIGEFDVTHDFKAGFVYDVPFGKGRQYLTHGPAAWIVGGWGVNGILTYASGLPIALTTSYTLPIYGATSGRSIPYITSYTGWQPHWSGSFDPTVDSFLVPYGTGPFPLQGLGTADDGFGNATRFNPKLRQFPNLNENLAVSRSFPIKERLRMEFRAEAFNVFNRVRFGAGDLNLQDANFGRLTSSSDLLNTPRQLQLALKLYF